MPIYTKWPRLIVVGEPVSEQQADEILIRTNHWWWLMANDRRWQRQVREVAAEFGRPMDLDHPSQAFNGEAYREASNARTRELMAWLERHDMLELEYLGNDRIMSSWVGGPHGWCDWDGRIGSTGYNIGKWPSDDDVTDEWRRIAEAFPYLTLAAQCVDEEGVGSLACEWRVANGTVRYILEPAELLAAPTEVSAGQMVRSVLLPGGERGVSLERLRQALERVTAGAR